MSGSRAGGLKAAQTNIKKFGKDFYREIGRKGGSISRRGPAKRIKEPSAEKAQKPKAEEPKKTWWGKLWGRENEQ